MPFLCRIQGSLYSGSGLLEGCQITILNKNAQAASRFNEPVDNQKKQYLNREDEVDAYARDIAKELRRNYTSKVKIPWNDPYKIRSKMLQHILATYNKYNITANRKRLLKRIIQYLEIL